MESQKAKPGRFKAWLQLLRVPNLLTVPGDPIAGYLLVAGTPYNIQRMQIFGGAAVCLLVYMAGLIHNDLCDLEEDRRERPSRPLACGAISPRAAWAVLVLLLTAAVVATLLLSCQSVDRHGSMIPKFSLEAMGTLTALILCVLLYNRVLKRIRVLGPLAMGACRSLSMAFGVVLAWGGNNYYEIYWAVWMMVAAVGLYIAAVTALAADETEEKRRGVIRFLPVIVPLGLLAWFTAADLWAYDNRAGALFALAALCAAQPIWALRGVSKPRDVQKQVGWLIRNLIVLQAAFAVLMPNPAIWVGILLFWPINAILAKRFYAS